jgi:hypothetical protein
MLSWWMVRSGSKTGKLSTELYSTSKWSKKRNVTSNNKAAHRPLRHHHRHHLLTAKQMGRKASQFMNNMIQS